mmetsp:Transcript_26387/g.66974  ORF Transcript_26387/g.66974 Transcript_26387/m.66974 type:complete len:217 (-) Transcript_26387:213-863(-)
MRFLFLQTPTTRPDRTRADRGAGRLSAFFIRRPSRSRCSRWCRDPSSSRSPAPRRTSSCGRTGPSHGSSQQTWQPWSPCPPRGPPGVAPRPPPEPTGPARLSGPFGGPSPSPPPAAAAVRGPRPLQRPRRRRLQTPPRARNLLRPRRACCPASAGLAPPAATPQPNRRPAKQPPRAQRRPSLARLCAAAPHAARAERHLPGRRRAAWARGSRSARR